MRSGLRDKPSSFWVFHYSETNLLNTVQSVIVVRILVVSFAAFLYRKGQHFKSEDEGQDTYSTVPVIKNLIHAGISCLLGQRPASPLGVSGAKPVKVDCYSLLFTAAITDLSRSGNSLINDQQSSGNEIAAPPIWAWGQRMNGE